MPAFKDSPESAVVLLQMGGPESVADLEPFLFGLFADPDIIQWPRPMRPFQGRLAHAIARRRAPKMAIRYNEIGGGSPLNRITEAQRRLLEAELLRRGRRARVFVANRYTAPRPDDAIRAIAAMRIRDITLLTLYPHWSRATTGSSEKDFLQAAHAGGFDGGIEAVRGWGRHRSYVSLLASQITEERSALAKSSGVPAEEVHVLFSAHGIPQRYADAGDPYRFHVEATARDVASRLGIPANRTSVSFQSAIGPVEWLRPYSDEHVRALASSGTRALLVVPLGFVSDHIETLYDIDRYLRTISQERGLPFARTPAFNESLAFSHALADILEEQRAYPSSLDQPWVSSRRRVLPPPGGEP